MWCEAENSSLFTEKNHAHSVKSLKMDQVVLLPTAEEEKKAQTILGKGEKTIHTPVSTKSPQTASDPSPTKALQLCRH